MSMEFDIEFLAKNIAEVLEDSNCPDLAGHWNGSHNPYSPEYKEKIYTTVRVGIQAWKDNHWYQSDAQGMAIYIALAVKEHFNTEYDYEGFELVEIAILLGRLLKNHEIQHTPSSA